MLQPHLIPKREELSGPQTHSIAGFDTNYVCQAKLKKLLQNYAQNWDFSTQIKYTCDFNVALKVLQQVKSIPSSLIL